MQELETMNISVERKTAVPIIERHEKDPIEQLELYNPIDTTIDIAEESGAEDDEEQENEEEEEEIDDIED
jgi:hypothetical protein